MIAPGPHTRRDVCESNLGTFRIVGQSGQGTALAADILAEVALLSGRDFERAEQHNTDLLRGGVTCTVSIGQEVPLAEKQPADYLVALDHQTGQRHLDKLASLGTLLTTAAGNSPRERLGDSRELQVHPPQDVTPTHSALFMLGALSRFLPIERGDWMTAIENHLPRKMLATGQEAFTAGARQMSAEQVMAAPRR